MDQLIRPIGIVHSAIKQSSDMPLQGVPATIEIYKEFLDGLSGIEEDTHINVIGWFDKAERGPLMVTPRKINPQLGKRGVFSLRSPARPNPLSLSPTRLLKVEKPLLYVEALDLIDASPVIDIKPYSAGWDMIFWARDKHSRLIAQAAEPEVTLASLTRQAYHFHGESCAATAIAARIVYDAATELESDQYDLVVELPRHTDPHLIDSLIGITRATPGNGRLFLCGDTRGIALSSSAKNVSYHLRDVVDPDITHILSSPAQALFERVG